MPEILYGEILGPEKGGADDEARSAKIKRTFWATFRKAIRYIPFADDLVAAYFCALDPATPHRVRAILLGALAYFVLPIDAVPDFLAGIGFLRRRDGADRSHRHGARPYHAGPPRSRETRHGKRDRRRLTSNSRHFDHIIVAI